VSVVKQGLVCFDGGGKASFYCILRDRCKTTLKTLHSPTLARSKHCRPVLLSVKEIHTRSVALKFHAINRKATTKLRMLKNAENFINNEHEREYNPVFTQLFGIARTGANPIFLSDESALYCITQQLAPGVQMRRN